MKELYIDTPDGLHQLCDSIRNSPWIALDTEFFRESTYHPRLCLIQLSNGEVAACIDPIKLTDLSPLLDILFDPNIVKVVTDRHGMAFYFSRASIPYHRGEGQRRLFKHVGLYVYRRRLLLDFFSRTEPSLLEGTERLEQLRVLEHGYRIKVVETPNDSIGVDTPADLERVRRLAEQKSATPTDEEGARDA